MSHRGIITENNAIIIRQQHRGIGIHRTAVGGATHNRVFQEFHTSVTVQHDRARCPGIQRTTLCLGSVGSQGRSAEDDRAVVFQRDTAVIRHIDGTAGNSFIGTDGQILERHRTESFHDERFVLLHIEHAVFRVTERYRRRRIRRSTREITGCRQIGHHRR